MTKLSYERLVTSFLKSLTHFVGVYGGVSVVKAIPGDPRGETCTCVAIPRDLLLQSHCGFYGTYRESHGFRKNCVISARRS